MSRDIYITITGAGGACLEGKGGGRSGPGTSDPGEDLTQAPVSNPGEDLTQAPVSNPGEDLTQAPVSNPDQIALAVALAQALGGSSSASTVQVGSQGTGGQGCCCPDSQKEGDPATGLSLKLEYSGFVIVRMRPEFSPKDQDWTLLQLADRYPPALEGLRKVLETDFSAAGPPLSSWPLIVSSSCQAVLGNSLPQATTADCRNDVRLLEEKAARTPFPPLHSLADYWRVDARHLGANATPLVTHLNRLAEVDLAYRELAATDPGLTTSFDNDQSYLEAAPTGIGARCVPALNTPTSVQLVDLEQGWHAEHQNLGMEQAQILGGANRAKADPAQGHHGTAVVGQWVGRKDSQAGPSVQVEGILPETHLDLASHYFGSWAPDLSHLPDHDPPTQVQPTQAPAPNGGPLTGTNGHVANAIVATLIYHDFYLDSSPIVLLLEVQRSLLPTEVDPADFDAIRLATALGKTVVEAAGNGGANLDAYMDPRGVRTLNRNASGFKDSGAILVGAAWSALPHNRAYFSNFGSRVDCFAWGDGVTTCGYGDLYGEGVNDFYTGNFSGTSSASPIIAGAAGLLQGLAKETTGVPLPPTRIRALLADPGTGTPQGPDVAGAIGVMPNLKAILAETLCLGPDVYLRNNPCDTGSHLAPEDLASCPDILVHDQDLAPGEAQKEFGEQGPWADVTAPKYLYGGLRNKGLGKAQVSLDLYGARPATLLTPGCWQRLEHRPEGTPDTKPPEKDYPVQGTVEQGDQLTATHSLCWRPNEAPMNLAAGEGCALMAVEREADPKNPGALVPQTLVPQDLPPDGKYFQLKDLLSFYRQKTVGVRNVHVLSPNWSPPDPLVFDLTSTPDRARRYDFEILQRLPKDVTVSLKMPAALEAKLRKSAVGLQLAEPGEQTGTNSSDDTALLVLPPGPCLRFEGVSLAAGVCAQITLKFEDHGNSSQHGYGLSIRQLYLGVEIGRITWLFRETVAGS